MKSKVSLISSSMAILKTVASDWCQEALRVSVLIFYREGLKVRKENSLSVGLIDSTLSYRH